MAVDEKLNILVTGGAGFVGSYLCRELADLGHNVRIVDIQEQTALAERYDCRCIDILDKDGLTEAMEGIDLVIHLAAKHRFFGVSEREFFSVNRDGTKNILEVMDLVGVKKIVLYSSVAVYGETNGPTNENTVPKPNNPYGLSKLAAEQLVMQWAAKELSRGAIIFRPTVIFGPYNRGNVYRLIRQIHKRLFFPVGQGENIKSVAYIDNIIAATLFLIQQNVSGLEIFNYSDSPHLTFREIINLIYADLGRKVPNYHLPLQPALNVSERVDSIIKPMGIEFSLTTAIKKMNKSTHHDADKIKSYGFAPEVSLEEGLRRMISWYLSRNNNSSQVTFSWES